MARGDGRFFGSGSCFARRRSRCCAGAGAADAALLQRVDRTCLQWHQANPQAASRRGSCVAVRANDGRVVSSGRSSSSMQNPGSPGMDTPCEVVMFVVPEIMPLSTLRCASSVQPEGGAQWSSCFR